MGLVDLSCTMRPASQVGIGKHGEPAIRLSPIKPNEIPGIDPSHNWAWAIVQMRKNEPDALLVGGTAESLTAAEGQAREAWATMGSRWYVKSGRGS
jgi:antitoxin (DNA-binding transcriptional repressor) of toxin-antitoxin stability system